MEAKSGLELGSSPPRYIRCVVADLSVVFLVGLAGVLEAAGATVVAQVTSPAELASFREREDFDVVIIGFEPVRDAIAAAKDFTDKPVLLLSSSAGRDDVVTSLRSGVSGMLSKNAAAEEIVKSLHHVANGYLVYSDARDALRADTAEWDPLGRPCSDPLTARERQILDLIRSGHTTKQLARRLGIAPQTAKNHIHNIMVKAGVSSRVELVSWAADRGHPADRLTGETGPKAGVY